LFTITKTLDDEKYVISENLHYHFLGK